MLFAGGAAARRAAGPGAAGLHELGVLRRRPGRLARALLRRACSSASLFVVTVPRLLNLAIKPGKVYPLYGFHYWIHRAIARLTNSQVLHRRSSATAPTSSHYLRALGYDLSQVEQTGSNFGTAVKHETPFLSSVGSGTMVADGLSIINADFSSTSFRVSRVSIGPHNFLGNHDRLPRAGPDRATTACSPRRSWSRSTGTVREGVGLLGSPSFEIPRSVAARQQFDQLKHRRRAAPPAAAKNRHNAVTIALFLLVRWIHALRAHPARAGRGRPLRRVGRRGDRAGRSSLASLFTVVYFVLVERAVDAVPAAAAAVCSIYDPLLLAARALLEGAVDGLPAGSSTAPRSRT